LNPGHRECHIRVIFLKKNPVSLDVGAMEMRRKLDIAAQTLDLTVFPLLVAGFTAMARFSVDCPSH
jgi:hypothetical protein